MNKKQIKYEKYKCANCGKVFEDRVNSYSIEFQKKLCCCYLCSEELIEKLRNKLK
jgi:DNA-directed RNA polymerase subunit RPC12/RpoP